MKKNSPAMIAIIAVIILIGLFGVYKVIHHMNRINSQPVATQTSTPTAKPSSAMMSNQTTVTLMEENKSGEAGTAVMKEENGKTTVTIALTGFVKDVVQPAHIHVGACPGVGAVKYPLTNVVNGSSVTVLPVTIAELKQNLPLALNVHKSAKEITNYTSCGVLTLK